MPSSNLPIIVIGAGGHAKVIIDTLKASSSEILGFTNLTDEIKSIYGVPYLGNDDFIRTQKRSEVYLVLGIGSVKSPLLRKQIFEKWENEGFKFASVIHPSVTLSGTADIATGSQILMGAVVQSGVKIKKNCILNTSCSIDHDCVIGPHSHIAPGATLCGDVMIGERVHVGAGASIIQGIRVEDGATVGAGAVVVKSVLKNKIVIGVPAVEFLKL